MYEKEKFIEAREVIQKMARMNGANLPHGSWVFDTEFEAMKSEDRTYKVNHSSTDVGGVKEDEQDVRKSLTGRRMSAYESMAVEEKESPFKLLRRDPVILKNLAIILTVWVSTSFNSYMLGFNTRNMGGNIYTNNLVLPFMAMVGKLAAIPLKHFFSSKIVLIFLVSFVAGFGFMLIIITDGPLVSVFIGLTQFGMAGSFAVSYAVTTEYFPALFLAFAFAVCQFGARGMTIFSYVLSDIKAPVPMIILCASSAVALIALFFLTKPLDEQNEDEQEDDEDQPQTNVSDGEIKNGKKYAKLEDED